jgi:hypothetical protein
MYRGENLGPRMDVAGWCTWVQVTAYRLHSSAHFYPLHLACSCQLCAVGEHRPRCGHHRDPAAQLSFLYGLGEMVSDGEQFEEYVAPSLLLGQAPVQHCGGGDHGLAPRCPSCADLT